MAMPAEALKKEKDPAGPSARSPSPKPEIDPHLNVSPEFLKQVMQHLVQLSASADEKRATTWQPVAGDPQKVVAVPKSDRKVKVPGPRKYLDDERIKQRCRWISTSVYLALRTELKNENIVEVQTTIWPPDKPGEARLYISANKPPALSVMKKWFARGTARQVLAALRQNPDPDSVGIGKRATRHPPELQALLNSAAPPDDPILATIHAALDQPLTVAMGSYKKKRPVEGEHAERRLHVTLSHGRREGVVLNPRHVGGIKRPCVFCYLALYAKENPNDVHPGAWWFSTKAAHGAIDPSISPGDVAAIIYEKVPATYLGVTGDEDTDSERD